MITRSLSATLVLFLASQSVLGQTMLGPTPYLSTADSPWAVTTPAFALETFEDHLFNVPGVSANAGYVTSTHFTGNIDSVDGDDGIVGNGACASCDSYFNTGSVVYTFDAALLGGLPKKVGIVWTDGAFNITVTFKAFDVNGVVIGTIVAPNMGDQSNTGTTAEDRFFGVDYSGGIKSISISNSGGGLETDHLQYELPCASTVSAVYCTAKVNALGCTPSISNIGTPSASASSGFTVRSVNMRNTKPGILLYTNGGRAAAPFTGGTLCLAGPLKRVQGLNSGGTPAPANDCTGVLSVDMNAFRAGLLGGNPAAFLSIPGTVVDAQFWGRDPGFTAPNNTQLSNALEYSICQ